MIDCIETAQVVAHEVVHAMLPKGAGHGPKFAKVMKYLGATGKPTSTVAGPKFTMDYQPFIEKLGMLPHSRMKSPAPKTEAQLQQSDALTLTALEQVTSQLLKAGD